MAKSQIVTLRIPEIILTRLDATAKTEGISRAAVIVQALSAYLPVGNKPAALRDRQPDPLPTDFKPAVAPPTLEEIVTQKGKSPSQVGNKCPHGWMNWLQCGKCNP
jgi:hypothetical protein